jgi:hypothetical protein
LILVSFNLNLQRSALYQAPAFVHMDPGSYPVDKKDMKQRRVQPASSADNHQSTAADTVEEAGRGSTPAKVTPDADCSLRLSRAKLWMQSHSRQSPHRAAGLLLFTVVLISTLLLQTYAIIFEKQGPLDHLSQTILWKPYYGMHCPAFSIPQDATNNQKLKTDNKFVQPKDGFEWSCKSITGDETPFPRIVLIGARTKEENNTWPEWKEIIWNSVDTENFLDGNGKHNFPRIQRINTLKVSNQYALNGGALRQSDASEEMDGSDSDLKNQFTCLWGIKWEHRLFAVYQKVFDQLRTLFPDDNDVVIVEDDAVLLDPTAFVEEVCQARAHDMQFYSLYRSPLQWKGRYSVSCVYEHGTVAFYARKSLMETVRNENRRRWFCRFPVDMYISKLGPWYATRREIVGHLDGGRVGSASKNVD